MSEPTADRPLVPAEYGIPTSTEELLPWEHLDDRLREATVYWLATSGPGGVPRVRPVDGLWLDGRLYVGGSPATRWVRDILQNQRVAVHLDGGWDVAILEGVAKPLAEGMDRPLAERLAALAAEKYPQYGMTAESYLEPSDGGWVFVPERAFGWKSFPKDVTRYLFG
ncbi:pyridoxamine 5'-phosphate oxidase family protein [soil metagenome]